MSAAADRRHAALALAIAFGFVFVSRGVADTWVVFLLPIEQELGATRQQTAGVYSTAMLTSGLSAPLAAMLLRRCGARVSYGLGVALVVASTLLASRATALWHLYLCIGLACSLGLSAIGIVPASALIAHWFQRRMSTAMAAVYAGLGCGALLMVPLAQWSIERQGWRATYVSISIGVAVILAITLLLPWRRIAGTSAVAVGGGDRGTGCASTAGSGSAVSDAAGSGTAVPGVEVNGAAGLGAGITLLQALRRREFAGLAVAFGMTGFSMYMVMVQVVPFLVENGHAQLKAAATFGMSGMLSIGGVMASGWLSDRFGLRPIALLSFGFSFTGILCLFGLSYVASEWLLVAYVAIFGIAQGARGPIVASLSNHLFSGPSAAAIYGVIYATSMVGAALGAWGSGYLHDLSASYRPGLLVAACGILIAASPFAFQRALRGPKRSVKSSRESSQE